MLDSYGRRIRELREAKELTQAALGRMIGASQPSISQWETEATVPSRMAQRLIAEALGVRRSWLFAEVMDAEDQAA